MSWKFSRFFSGTIVSSHTISVLETRLTGDNNESPSFFFLRIISLRFWLILFLFSRNEGITQQPNFIRSGRKFTWKFNFTGSEFRCAVDLSIVLTITTFPVTRRKARGFHSLARKMKNVRISVFRNTTRFERTLTRNLRFVWWWINVTSNRLGYIRRESMFSRISWILLVDTSRGNCAFRRE